MDRKGFLKNSFFAALSVAASKFISIEAATIPIVTPVANELILTEGSLMTYCTATDSAYITRQIAVFNKKWIESLDERILESLSQKIETQYA